MSAPQPPAPPTPPEACEEPEVPAYTPELEALDEPSELTGS